MADTETKTPKIPARPPALGSMGLRSAPHERAHFFAVVPSNTTFEQVMTPNYWQNHVAALRGGATVRPFALVEVVREDGTMDLLLRVIDCKPGMVTMRCLTKYVSDENMGKPAKGAPQPGDESLKLPDGYKWAHVPNGASRGHMIRLPSGDVLVQGKATKADAVAAAWDHFNVASTPALAPA